jgi:uncharacterized cupredoxin-like copper-binding protein
MKNFSRSLLLCVMPALASAFWPAQAADAEQNLNVILTEFDFTPKNVSLNRGERSRLHLENRGAEMHEFTAPEFFRTADIENPDALNGDLSSVVLQPHETKDVVLVPRQAGHYELLCADHDWAGMIGSIEVR